MVPTRLRRFVIHIFRVGGSLALDLATLTLASVIPGSAASAQSGPKATAVTSFPKGSFGGGKVTIGPGRTIHLPLPSKNPPHTTAPANRQSMRPPSSKFAVPLSPTGRLSTQSPLVPPTNLPPIYIPPTHPQPTDLVLFQNTTLNSTATAQQTSPDDEPSVASFANNIFYTGNFYASLSTDGGATFGYIDPYTEFPSVFNGFCCNQRALYVPSWDFTAWSMMYIQDANNNNVARLAVAQGSNGLASNTWTYWDFSAPDAGLPSGLYLDYPQIAYSANDLYLTANADNPDGSTYAAVIFRCPLSALATAPGGTDLSLGCTSFYLNNTDTFTPVDNADTTMYWANHLSNAALEVFTWPENVDWPGITSTDVEHSAYATTGNSCPSPDGTNMCGFESQFNPIHSGWLANGLLGFMWDAAQGPGGLGNFPFPYVHVVEINPANMTLIDEPVIWSIQVGWAFGAATPSITGGLGVSIASSGGGNNPGSVIMVRDNVNPTTWQPLYVTHSTNGPSGNRWGDYLTVRPYWGSGTTWVATSYTLQGACSDPYGPCSAVQPLVLSFGRESQSCQAITPQTSGLVPRVSHGVTLAGSSTFLPLVVNGACA